MIDTQVDEQSLQNNDHPHNAVGNALIIITVTITCPTQGASDQIEGIYSTRVFDRYLFPFPIPSDR